MIETHKDDTVLEQNTLPPLFKFNSCSVVQKYQELC